MTEHTLRKPQLNAADTLRTIGHSSYYNQERAALGDEAKTLEGRRLAIGKAAAHLCSDMAHERKSTHMNLEQHSLNVVGKLMESVDDIIMLQDIESGEEAQRNPLPHKRKVIEFDRALKEMVDDNPSVGFNETLRFLGQSIISTSGEDTYRKVADDLRAILVGMRHEIAAEQMFEYLDMEYRQTSIEEDLRGKDIVLMYEGKDWVGVDIKGSARGAEAGREKARSKGRNDNIIVWSHCHDEDFGNTFRLDNELIYEQSSAFIADVTDQLNAQAARRSA